MRSAIFIFYLFICSNVLSGQDDFVFMHDLNLSSISYGQNLISAHKLVSSYEDKLLKPKFWKEDNFIGKTLGIGYRLAKTFYLDLQIDYFAHLTQHEVFGHGYRMRQYGFTNNTYELNLRRPFGKGGGLARFGSPDPNRITGFSEDISLFTGGVEANTVLAKTLVESFMRSGEINYRESLLYTLTSDDVTNYIRYLSVPLGNDDIANYLRLVNFQFGFPSDEYALTLSYLKKYSLINNFNTFQLLSFYAFVVEYLYKGNTTFKYPKIKFGKVGYLPSLRFGLSPFGSEFILDNYFISGDKFIEVNLRVGDGKLANSLGIGYAIQKPISVNTEISYSLDVWHQPGLFLGGTELYETKGGYGGMIAGEIHHRFKSFPMGIVAKVGYKTAGFKEGERLDNGLLIRVGMSIKNFIPESKPTDSEIKPM